MKKIIKVAILFLVFPVLVFTQSVGNEWIDFGQNYYRMPIPETGVYKITRSDLIEAGINNFFSQQYQLFQNGEEIPCYIKEDNGLIDYILFYANKNNGKLDIDMYDDPDHQTNPYHSLISDTASVFLTFNESVTNKRFLLETDTNFDGYTPAEFCWAEGFAEYTRSYFQALEDCEYVEAEGWFDNQILQLGKSITKYVSTPDFVNVNRSSQLELAYISMSKSTGNFDNLHHVKVTAPNFVSDTVFSNYKSIKLKRELTFTNLDTATAVTFENINDKGSESSRIAASYIKIKYTRGFNLGNKNTLEFELPKATSSKSYVRFNGDALETSYYLFDITNNKLIKTVVTSSTIEGLVPASDINRNLVLVSETSLKNTKIEKTSFVDYSNKSTNYLIISHPKLSSSAQAYADYRNTYWIDVNELYDQFAYGVQKHPMAIRNFIKYLNKTWENLPEHLFLIGKAIETYQTRYNSSAYANCLVPTMGQYGSDVLLSNKVGNTGYLEAIPTGRLAAYSNTEVLLYLNKVDEFEKNPVSEWMKKGIHFGGGKNSTEQRQFKQNLEKYEETFADSLFGGTISTFLKTSSDPIVISKFDSIESLVNNGVSIMTFFGHGSAAGGFDQNIDEASAYRNSGKYPLMIANSCYTGNIHLNGKISKSEEWVLIADKGAIGFFAVVGSGWASYLNILSGKVYDNIARLNYGASIGKCILSARQSMQRETNVDIDRIARLTLQEFTLHGDPAIVLNSFPKPDLKIESHDVSFIPQNLTTDIDSFYIQIISTNQARTTDKTFVIDFDRVFQTGKTENHYYELHGLKYKDTTRIKLGVDHINGFGNNKFTIRIDNNNNVDELDELNNIVEVNAFIGASDLVPVNPYQYGMLPSNNLVLKANSVDVFADEQTSVFQLDSSYNFNSPVLTTDNITHQGGVVEWQPQITISEGETYFWRVAKQGEVPNWITSSFHVNSQKIGWHQSSYGQFRENDSRFIEFIDSKEKYEYSKSPKTLLCKNLGSPANEPEYRSIVYSIDQQGEGSSCGAYGAMLLVVIDSLTLQPWESNYGALNGITVGHGNDPWCGNKTSPQKYFIFYSSSNTSINNLINFVNNHVPDGNYILIYSFINGNFDNYTSDMFSAFESWGAEEIRFTRNYFPYIFFAQKGNPESAREEIGETTRSSIELYQVLKSNFTYGSITTPAIGPAISWSEVNWDYYKQEANNSEEIAYVKLYGVGADDNLEVLNDSLGSGVTDISNISATEFPYLKMEFFTKDETYRTPSQLNFWEVLYNPVTDLAINPKKGYEFYADTLHEGESGSMAIAFENIGMSDNDSTRVNYWIQSESNEHYPLKSSTIKPLKTGENIVDTVTFSTLAKQGNYALWIELNPKLADNNTKHTREQYYFNNVAQKPFFVKGDKTNPLLDVTFDGIHIMDGDIVSPNPEIVIQLKDENAFIALSDTSVFAVYLKSQSSGLEEKISISSNSDMVFIPATLPKNKAKLLYSPTFTDDGIYELRVQAKDPSGNESGAFDYLISFQVITESTITNVFNYPNPFSTATKFVFELTGSEIPDAIRIEILTVTGKVVKVIYEDELGPLRIGKNITEYTWNGTDMYGDPLANGVYFYRVNARIAGKELKIRDTGTGKYFKNGFGKMYIMR